MPVATQASRIRAGSEEYMAERMNGPDQATIARNLAECNFHGLRRLEAYAMAGADKRRAFSQDLARGKMVNSCPFPFEVALLRALHMGMTEWNGGQESVEEVASAYVRTLRFGVSASHLTSVVEYSPEVFFRAFQGMEVHRDVPYLADANDEASSIDWMDFRICKIPDLEKDLVWDLFLMDLSPWASPSREVVSLGQAAIPELRGTKILPMMVARERNRDRPDIPPGHPFIGMATPGASLHLCMASGAPTQIGGLLPTLIGEPMPDLVPPAKAVGDLLENDRWLVVTYTPPPPMADKRLMYIPPQLRVEEDL